MQVSNYFREFVAYYVEEAVFNGEQTSRNKYLQRYCAMENCDYEALQENLTLLIDALNEYLEKKSKVFIKLAKVQSQYCFLPENFIEDISDMLSSWVKGYAKNYFAKKRGGDIFDDMPGGHMLKDNKT